MTKLFTWNQMRSSIGLAVLSLVAGYSGTAQEANIIRLSPERSAITINKHIYGHFAEHLGRCIYDGFYVGETNTTLPHTAGVRDDVIAALKKLQIPNLRWPNGCFADTYHWKDGIGPKEDRPTVVNT